MAVFPFKQKHKQEYTLKKLNVVNFLFLRVDKTCLKSCFFNIFFHLSLNFPSDLSFEQH